MDKKEKNNIVVPIICLLISIGLWVYVTNIENKIRTTEISKIPVELINSEALTSSKLALAPGQSFYATLKVEGNTTDINKIKKSDFKLQVDLSEYAWKKGENKVPVSIVDYPITVSVKNTNTLVISVNIEEMVEKTMPITSNIEVTPKSGYFASQPIITPKEVEVTGAESMVNKVARLEVKDNIEEIDENISKDYEIIPVDEDGNKVTDVEISEKTAKVEIKVSKGKSVNINVSTTGKLPDNVKLASIESSRKTVEIIGPEEILDTINELSTTPIDLSSITGSKDINLSVIIPDGVSVAEGEKMLTATVNVIPMKTKEFSVKLNISGANDGLNVLPNKENIKVIIKGFEDELANVTEDNITASLDISSYNKEGTFEVKPKVTLKNLNKEVSIESVEEVTLTVSKNIAQGSQDEVRDESNNGNTQE